MMKEMNRKISIKVGILAPEASKKHSGSNLTMAELGMIHEFGSADGKIPARSFLRVPILSSEGLRKIRRHYREILYNDLEVDRALCSSNKNHLTDASTYAAEMAHYLVLEAFATAGGGSWEPIKSAEDSKILIDTKELMRSISYKVEE